MRKLIVIWIAMCFVASIGVVVGLFALSKDIRKQPGSFLREFPPHPAMEGEVFDLGYNSYYIAGATERHVYLANYTAPLHLLVINTVQLDTQHVKLKVDWIGSGLRQAQADREGAGLRQAQADSIKALYQKFWALRVKVDSPYYYVTDGTVPIIYQGSVHDWMAERYVYDHAYFQDVVPISNESFYIRALGKPVRENVLGKLTFAEPHLQMKPGILQKQVDGIFCTDGMMHYNKALNELLYLYRYRNEYIVMDTNLNVLRRLHTIDTTIHAKIEVGTIESTGETKFASPQRVVNKDCAVQGKLLFVNSALLAKNEHPKTQDHATAIDVYDVTTGTYRFSFYIYDFQGKEKLRMFSVAGNKLYALHETHLQVWHLDERYFMRVKSGMNVNRTPV